LRVAWAATIPVTAVLLLSLLATPAAGYVEVPYTLGRIVQESTTIVLLRVEKVDLERNLLYIRGAVPGPKTGIVVVRKQG